MIVPPIVTALPTSPPMVQALVRARPEQPVAWLADWLIKHDPGMLASKETVIKTAPATVEGSSGVLPAEMNSNDVPARAPDESAQTVQKETAVKEDA